MNLDGADALDPMDVEEGDNIVFHFERAFPAGTTLISATVDVGLHSGVDPSPQDIKDGAHQIVGMDVIQPFIGTVPEQDNVYWIRCVATPAVGRPKTIWGRLRILLMR